jgi:hypothetical protein
MYESRLNVFSVELGAVMSVRIEHVTWGSGQRWPGDLTE